jgi:hypothetical protein
VSCHGGLFFLEINMSKYIVILMAFFMAGAVMAAQEDPKATETSVKSSAQPQLNESLRQLGFFQGKWEVEQQIKAHGQQASQMSHGAFNVESAMGGYALVGHFESDMQGGEKFYGHMVITADKPGKMDGDKPAAAADKKFGFFWADSQGISSLSHDVTFSGDRLTITAEDYFGAKRGKARISYTKKTDDRIDFNMEAETEKGWETQIMGSYRKIGG